MGSTAGDNDGQIVVLVRRTVVESGSLRERRVVEERRSIGLLDRVHFSDDVSELLQVKLFDLQDIVDYFGLIVRHLMMAAWCVKQTLE